MPTLCLDSHVDIVMCIASCPKAIVDSFYKWLPTVASDYALKFLKKMHKQYSACALLANMLQVSTSKLLAAATFCKLFQQFFECLHTVLAIMSDLAGIAA